MGWSLALSLVLVLASFAGTAPAATNVSCDNGAYHNPDSTSDPFDFSIMACRATPGDNVDFTLGRLQDGDIWEIDYNDGSGSTGMIISGVTDSDSVSDRFQMPDVGGSDRDLELDVYVLRNAEFVGGPPAFKLTGFGYVAAPGSAGGAGPTGTIGAPGFIAAPGAVSRGTTGNSSPSKKPKAKSKSGSKSKSKGNQKKAGSSPNKTKTPAPLVPQTPVSTPTPSPAPVATAAPQATPLAAPKPPGPAGPPGSPESPLPVSPNSSPSSPTTGAPIVPAASKSSDSGLAVPVWLVVLLGLITLGGLGGAQMRMLGMWGPGPVPAGAEGQDPRLVALGRVAQSGASYQKRIADLKKAARDRSPVG